MNIVILLGAPGSGKGTIAGKLAAFREAEYEITIHPNGAQKGVKSITLDGQPIEGTVIPYSTGKHVVEVVM